MRLHPEVATRDCSHCQIYLYDEKTGEVKERRGKPIKRPPGTAPCRTNTGCPKGTPENNTTLTGKNLLALLHYEECKAVGQFPDDPIVRRNAAILRRIDEEVVQRERQQQNELMVQLMTVRV